MFMFNHMVTLKFSKDWWQKNQIFIHDICSLWL